MRAEVDDQGGVVLDAHDPAKAVLVVSVEDDTALVIDFGAHRMRITTPCAKLTKL